MKRRFVSSAAFAFGLSALVAAASNSPVADAAMKGDREALRALLKQGAERLAICLLYTSPSPRDS